jgi:hypothetical protein
MLGVAMNDSLSMMRVTGNETESPGFGTLVFANPYAAHGICQEPFFSVASKVNTFQTSIFYDNTKWRCWYQEASTYFLGGRGGSMTMSFGDLEQNSCRPKPAPVTTGPPRSSAALFERPLHFLPTGVHTLSASAAGKYEHFEDGLYGLDLELSTVPEPSTILSVSVGVSLITVLGFVTRQMSSPDTEFVSC